MIRFMKNYSVILRMWAFPMVLVVVYVLQQQFPAIHQHCALWSDHPHWWQFFTCNFLSNDLWHLVVNVGGLVIVYSQFAPRLRFSVLVLAFCFFATLSTWMFHEWWMPKHTWLIGASGGSYALLGFFSWFLRKARFCLFKWLDFPILPVLVAFIVGEYFYARWRMPSLAWQLHAIGFGLGLAAAQAIHALYAAAHWLADREGSVVKNVFAPGALIFRQIKRLSTVPLAVSVMDV